jgi:phosphoribosylformylglycinamidine synthase
MEQFQTMHNFLPLSANVLISFILSQSVVNMFIADIRITLKKGVADPEGKNTLKAMELLGFSQVTEVKTSKFFSVRLDTADEADARSQVERLCQNLLANPVINEYSYQLRQEA